MSRSLFGLLLLLSVICSGGMQAVAAETTRPNVLFIAVDDLNDWISCLGGHPDCKTPNIDRLAARGLLFTNSHCAAPACNPSRAALLTGIRPSSSGVYLNSQPWRPAMQSAVTLPQHFRNHGYQANGSGKIFHGRYNDYGSWDDYLKQTGDPKPTPAVLQDPHSRAGTIIWGVLDAQDQEMSDYKMANYAIEFLGKPDQKPFFLACGIYRPHMPWQVPRKYYDMYPLDKIHIPEVPEHDLDDIPPAGVRMARPQGDHAKILKTENWRYAVQAYLASIAFADVQVGRVLDALDASPYAKNTIVVLWGDHGWHLGEKHHWRKFSLWEEATRAPLMMVVPGVTQVGTRCDQAVDFMNIYPTLCELCDLPRGDHLDGISMVSLLKDPSQTWERPALTTHGRLNHAVRDNRYRLIRYQNGDEELYDHSQDPMEWKNLADDPRYADIKQKLAKWFPEKNAPDAPHDPELGKNRKNKRQQGKGKQKKKAAKS
ncbi:sulfatase [Gimesia panareensis]|uniref:Choline-sulfatase n=1 Tax=Gimesia panareensis TaxID=2527978 RepID=A0A517QDS5_9PLAN|nr:sulfatase [Gimesia panareensis]QDT29764.1 Choline-sulfatase [Gimesia panareensis]QDU52845.1 Choline-sulfatase [Gimesia panareensis]